jgi:RNA polymerase sigma-70 factor (ECF subfamily)
MSTDYRPLAETSEAELVQLAQDRNQDAFAELMRRNASASFRLALSILKDRQDAEDEVQSSFFKAWKNLSSFHSESRFSTWFRTIVMNQSFMRLRTARRARVTSLDDRDEDGLALQIPAADPTPETTLSRNELSRQLNTEVQKLPRILRDVLILRDLKQLSTEESAVQLGISVPAIKTRLSRAREMLRQRMARYKTPSAGMPA